MPKSKHRAKDKYRDFSGTWAEAVRDIVCNSISKGQLLLLGIIFIIILLIWKMPNEDCSKLLFDIKVDLLNGRIIGWFLLIVVLISWFLHSRYQRRLIHREMIRISQQRDGWQKKAIGEDKIESSDK